MSDHDKRNEKKEFKVEIENKKYKVVFESPEHSKTIELVERMCKLGNKEDKSLSMIEPMRLVIAVLQALNVQDEEGNKLDIDETHRLIVATGGVCPDKSKLVKAAFEELLRAASDIAQRGDKGIKERLLRAVLGLDNK